MLVTSGMSSSAADEGRLDKAKLWGQTSLGFNIAGIVVAVVVVIVISVVQSTNVNDSSDSYGVYCGGERCNSYESCCESAFSNYFCC